MFGSERPSAAAGIARRVAALKDELSELEDTLFHRESGWDRAASEARHWLAEQAGALARPVMAHARHPAPPAVLAVAAAALTVGVGVGCVLYALTASRAGKRPASAPEGAARRPASRVAE